MDYGTTGPVSPASSPAPMTPVPTEDEMSKLQDIFRRAAQAIVDVSGLTAKVSELTAKVESLTHDIDGYRDRVRWLDQELDEVRQSRNAQRDRAEKAEALAVEVEAQAQAQAVEIDTLKGRVESLTSRLHETEKARDDAELRVMELEDKLKVAEGRIARLKDFAATEFGLAEPKAPEPEPTPSQAPASEPTPAPEPEPGPVDWSRPYGWSERWQRWVNIPSEA